LGFPHVATALRRNEGIRLFRSRRCRAVVIALLGLSRRRVPSARGPVPRDVYNLLGKLVFGTALHQVWDDDVVKPKKSKGK